MRNIKKTKDLKLEDIPNSNSSIKMINEFALSFEFEEQNGQILNENLNSEFDNLEIVTLRAILFAERRRWNHFGKEYDRLTEERIRVLITVLREKLAKGV